MQGPEFTGLESSHRNMYSIAKNAVHSPDLISHPPNLFAEARKNDPFLRSDISQRVLAWDSCKSAG